MNKIEFKKLRGVDPVEKLVTIEDLKDKSDRTLLYGYTCSRTTWHVYIKNKKIIKVVYGYKEKPRKIEVKCNLDYVPNKRLYPDKCDYEFCKLLKENDTSLCFTTFHDDTENKIYFGEILE